MSHKILPQATQEIHQCITSIPSLDDKAFEACRRFPLEQTLSLTPSYKQELRLECYAQSLIATGSTPAPCNPQTPWMAIPPLFRPVNFPIVSDGTSEDVVTSTEVSTQSLNIASLS